MKACVLEEINQIRYQEVATPVPNGQEVLLRVKACGICSSDIDRIRKTGTYRFPTIPGHEFSGEIIAQGNGLSESMIGRRAVVFPLLPCGTCAACETGNYALCENYSYFGSRCDGGFAEFIAVPAWNLVFIDDSLEDATAALCEPTAVALHAVKKAEIKPGMKVAVIGSGTIGIISALWVKESGGIPVIFGQSERKKEFIESMGLEYKVGSSAVSIDADAALECVGTESAVGGAVASVKRGGTVVLMGNPASDITFSRNNYWSILRKELTVKGTWNSSFNQKENDWIVSAAFLTRKKNLLSRLITHRFLLHELERGLKVIEEQKELAVKVMIINE